MSKTSSMGSTTNATGTDMKVPVTAMSIAIARLEDSRARLRLELLPQPKAPHAGGAGKSASDWLRWPSAAQWPLRLRALWRHGRQALRRVGAQHPLAGMALAAVQDAWQHHPWRATAQLLGREASAAVLPAVRRHPFAAVVIAAGLGMAAVASRRWHWPLLTRRLRRSPGQLGGWLLHQLTQAPMQTAVVSALVMWAQRARSGARDPDGLTPDQVAQAADVQHADVQALDSQPRDVQPPGAQPPGVNPPLVRAQVVRPPNLQSPVVPPIKAANFSL